MMTCEQIEELLMPYLLDELDEHRDADVYIHLRGCDDCRMAAKEMESTVNLLQDAFELDIQAPTSLTEVQKDTVRKAVAVDEQPNSRTIITWFKDQHISMQTIAAVLVLCAVLTVAIPMAKIRGVSEAEFAPKQAESTAKPDDGKKAAQPAAQPSVVNGDMDGLSDAFHVEVERPEEESLSDEERNTLIERGREEFEQRELIAATEISLGSAHDDTISSQISSAGRLGEDKDGDALDAVYSDHRSAEEGKKVGSSITDTGLAFRGGASIDAEANVPKPMDAAPDVTHANPLPVIVDELAAYDYRGEVSGGGGQGEGRLNGRGPKPPEQAPAAKPVPVIPRKKNPNAYKSTTEDLNSEALSQSGDNPVSDANWKREKAQLETTFESKSGRDVNGNQQRQADPSTIDNAEAQKQKLQITGETLHDLKKRPNQKAKVPGYSDAPGSGVAGGEIPGWVKGDKKNVEKERAANEQGILGGKDKQAEVSDYDGVPSARWELSKNAPTPVKPEPPAVVNGTDWYVHDLSNEKGLSAIQEGRSKNERLSETSKGDEVNSKWGDTSDRARRDIGREAVEPSQDAASADSGKRLETNKEKTKVLGDIPLLGKLFSTTKTSRSSSAPILPEPTTTAEGIPVEELQQDAPDAEPEPALAADPSALADMDKEGEESVRHRQEEYAAFYSKDIQDIGGRKVAEDDSKLVADQTFSYASDGNEDANWQFGPGVNVTNVLSVDSLQKTGNSLSLSQPFAESDIVPDGLDSGLIANDRISISFEDAPASMVVNTFTKWSGANIIATPENINGTVSANFENADWQEALESVLGQINYELVENATGSGTYSIKPVNPDAPGLPAGVVGINYTVATGDTLSHIASRYGVPVSEIVTANSLTDPDSIRVDQVLIIPQEKDLKEEPAQEPEIKKAVDPESPAYKAFGVNPFIYTAANAFSTFSIDVDTASYTRARNYMMRGFLPPAESVRTEEFVNFFDYAYAAPRHATFQVHAEVAPTPFGRGLHALKIGVKGRHLGREEQKPAMLTFAIDTSGSMNTDDRLGLVQKSLNMLLDKLGPQDEVCIVQYNDQARLLLEHTPVKDKETILKAIRDLKTTGSTNLEKGVSLAYEMAAKGFKSGAVNRVLLLSDGVTNLGTDESQQILDKVSKLRKQGIFCSVFGFGIGNYNDKMLESLADKGDGSYVFIDSLEEAKRVFVDDLSATLNTIASDVKIQVEFNPEMVKQYRQLGYENRQLTKEQFRDDTVDAGEVGSGQAVTALYELELLDEHKRIGTVRVRYRDMQSGKIVETATDLTARMIHDRFEEADARFRLATGVAEFSEILRGSPHAKGSDYADVGKVLRPVALELNLDKQVQELVRLVEGAGGMSRAAE